ncbi:MAG: hypothetical protein JST89_24315 [Cyanobacteria bacterium SZAS-4]|nr:hypothetical protein [Cyanobacteria bacterium SZAS-4]
MSQDFRPTERQFEGRPLIVVEPAKPATMAEITRALQVVEASVKGAVKYKDAIGVWRYAEVTWELSALTTESAVMKLTVLVSVLESRTIRGSASFLEWDETPPKTLKFDLSLSYLKEDCLRGSNLAKEALGQVQKRFGHHLSPMQLGALKAWIEAIPVR